MSARGRDKSQALFESAVKVSDKRIELGRMKAV